MFETTPDTILAFLRAIKYEHIYYELKGKKKFGLIAKLLFKYPPISENPLNGLIQDVLLITEKKVYSNLEDLYRIIAHAFFSVQNSRKIKYANTKDTSCDFQAARIFPKNIRILTDHYFSTLITTSNSSIYKFATSTCLPLKLFSKISIINGQIIVQEMKNENDTIDVNNKEEEILIFARPERLVSLFSFTFKIELVDVHEYLKEGERVQKLMRYKLFENEDYLPFKQDQLFPTNIALEPTGNSFVICRRTEPMSKKQKLYSPFLVWYEKKDGSFYNELKLGFQNVKTTVKTLVGEELANDSYLKFCMIQNNFIIAVLSDPNSVIYFQSSFSYVMLFIYDCTKINTKNRNQDDVNIIARVSVISEGVIKKRPYLAKINPQSLVYDSKLKSCYLSEKLNLGKVKEPLFGIQSGRFTLEWFSLVSFTDDIVKNAQDISVLFYEDDEK